MRYESTSAAGDPNLLCLDFRETASAIVDKTRQAWIPCPEELPPLCLRNGGVICAKPAYNTRQNTMWRAVTIL